MENKIEEIIKQNVFLDKTIRPAKLGGIEISAKEICELLQSKLSKEIKNWQDRYHEKCEDAAKSGAKASLLTKEIEALKEQLRWIKDRHPETTDTVLLHYKNCGQLEYNCAYFLDGKYYWNGSDVQICPDLENDFIGWLPIPEIK